MLACSLHREGLFWLGMMTSTAILFLSRPMLIPISELGIAATAWGLVRRRSALNPKGRAHPIERRPIAHAL